jgi:hypothetical protein
MNISNLFNFSTFGSKSQHSSVAQPLMELSPLAQAVQRADQRVQLEVSANTAQMSSFGQLKSSVSQVQIAANALSGLTPDSSAEQSGSALNRLVNAVNTAITTALSTASLPGDPQASQSAIRIAAALQGLDTSQGTDAQALKAVGLSLQNGKLTVDAAQLNAAVLADPAVAQSTLGSMGTNLAQMASTELSTQGDVYESLNQLKRHANTLQAQQSALQSATQATSVYSNSRSGSVGYGIGVYQSNIG